MPRDPHYTVNRRSAATEKPSAVDVREVLADRLTEFYSATYHVILESRSHGVQWKRAGDLDITHPDEPVDNDLPVSTRIEQLVEEIIALAEAEGSEAPREVRLFGTGERIAKIVWRVAPWVVGETLLGSPQQQADGALASALATMARVNELQGRALERAYTRVDVVQDNAIARNGIVLGQLTTAAASLGTTLEQIARAGSAAAGPMVAMREIEKQERVAVLEADEQKRQGQADEALLMYGLEILSKIYMPAENAAAGDDETPIDTTATDGEPARKPAAGAGPRCKQARDLGGIFESLSAATVSAVREAFSQTEWDALEEAMRATTIEQFDACYGRWNNAVQSRPDEGVALMHSLAPYLKGHGMTFLRITNEFERRHPSAGD